MSPIRALLSFLLSANAVQAGSVLKLDFGTTSSNVAEYEAASSTSPFVLWSGGGMYFGTCFGGYFGPTQGGVGDISRGSLPSETFVTVEETKLFCLLGVPVSSYRIEVEVGDPLASLQQPSCWMMADGVVIYNGSSSSSSPQLATGRGVYHHQVAGSCLSLASCAPLSLMNTATIEQLACHGTCQFCTGVGAADCAVSCQEGRLLTHRDGGTYCDVQPPPPPGRPYLVGKPTNSTVTLSWSPPSPSGGAAITGYRVLATCLGREADESPPAPQVWIADTGSSAAEATVTELAGDTVYAFAIQAINSAGVGNASLASVQVRTAPVVPGAPALPAVTEVGQQWALISWQGPADNGGAAFESFSISASCLGSCEEPAEKKLMMEVVEGTAAAFQVNFTGLQGFSRYTFSAQAENSVGAGGRSPNSAEVRTLAVPPSAPGVPSAESATSDSIALMWSPPAFGGGEAITSYELRCTEVLRPEAAAAATLQGAEEVELVLSMDDSTQVNGTLGHSLDGLPGGACYSCSVAALNIIGRGRFSPASSALCASPVEPSTLLAPLVSDVEQYQVRLSWQPPLRDGGADVTGYAIWVQAEAASESTWMLWETLASAAMTTSVVSGLEGDTSYRFAVAALNVAGRSAPGLGSSAVRTLPVPPDPPQALRLTAALHSSIAVTWSAPTRAGGRPLAQYHVLLWETEEGGLLQSTAVGSDTKSAVATGLLGSTEYNISVVAVNEIGNSSESERLVVTTLPPVVPSAPRGLILSFDRPYEGKLTWERPEDDGGSPLLGFRAVLQPADGTQSADGAPATSAEPRATSMTVQNLLGETRCSFELSARNVVGDSPGVLVTGISPPAVLPAAPELVLITDIGQTGARVSWAFPAHDGGSRITGYVVEATSALFGSQLFETLSAAGPTLQVDNLVGGATYRFRVAAANPVGQGAWSAASEQVQLLPVRPGPPGQPTATGVQQHSVELSWPGPAWNGGSEVTDYKIWVQEAWHEDVASWRLSDATPGRSRKMLITQLAGGRPYRFRVAAVNAVGTGEAGSESQIISTLPVSPNMPPQPTVSDASASTIQLAWSAPEHDGGKAVSHYSVELSQGYEDNTPALVDFAEALTMSAETATLRGLLGLMNYQVRVVAHNEVGPSDPSPPVAVGTLPPTVPEPPRDLEVVFSAKHAATCSWQLLGDEGGRPVTSYRVQLGQRGGDFEDAAVVEAGASSSVTVSGQHSGRWTSSGCHCRISTTDITLRAHTGFSAHRHAAQRDSNVVAARLRGRRPRHWLRAPGCCAGACPSGRHCHGRSRYQC
eukprot:TRINITY_DN41576_c0_g2_i2.p1 TRINITY_DN41576_c0_g2~~TRINITY_DN41576_c0_g2_i2.p1  ORF type:complete len:1295 (-),score=240.31 TRINITY_DN41576_c0_g2_i2:1785-5669(-)